MQRVARAGLYTGIALVVLGLSKVHAAAHSYDFTASARFGWALAFIVACCVAAYSMGLPDLARSRRAAWIAALGAGVLAALAISVTQLLLGSALLPRSVVLGTVLVMVPWGALSAAVAGDAKSRASERDRVVVVADEDDIDALAVELGCAPERPASLVAALTPLEARPNDPPVRPLVTAAEAAHATVVVLGRTAQADESIVMQAALLHERGIRVRTLSLFYEQWLGKLPMAELERVSLLFDISEVHAPRYARLKRLLDVGVAAVALPVLGMMMPVVLVANRFGNRGPLFFRQSRTGRNGREFEMVKFRTMTPRGHGAGETTTIDDPRVTPFGRYLRRTHLDELPQLVNILRGELSVVGPRPEQPHLVEQLSAKIPFYGLRHLVRPGLTGWAQVKYHYGEDDTDALEKLQYEFFYLRRQSLGLDLRIVGRTLRSVFGWEGR
ncbi:MAG: sugar transferase [Acidimicrobiia bacterium]|jgi:lipopolysaccharide/colanic/teichoic acid biosynthesis glycosyltransferase